LLLLAVAAGFYVINDLVGDMAKGQTSMESARESMMAAKFNRGLILAEDCGLPIELGAGSEFVDLSLFMSVWPKDSSQMNEVTQRVAKKQYGAVVINSRDGCLLSPPYYWDSDFIKVLKVNYQPVASLKDDGRIQDFYLPRPDSSPQH
jgi:hypothetical protein